jgi:hypothetical protein
VTEDEGQHDEASLARREPRDDAHLSGSGAEVGHPGLSVPSNDYMTGVNADAANSNEGLAAKAEFRDSSLRSNHDYKLQPELELKKLELELNFKAKKLELELNFAAKKQERMLNFAARVITCAILALVLIVLDPDPKTIDLQAILPYLVFGGSAAGTALVWKMINTATNRPDGGGKKSKDPDTPPSKDHPEVAA